MRYVAIITLLLAACSESPEKAWVKKQQSDCHGLGGDRFSYTSGIALCSRKPFMRMPKKLFERRYKTDEIS